MAFEPAGLNGPDIGPSRRPQPTSRAKYAEFIETHNVAWDLTFGVLALVYVGMDIVFENATPATLQLVETVQLVITGIFAIEFFSRLWAAVDRSRHLREHLIDAVALLPPVRSLRLLRLVRLVGVVARLHRGGMSFAPLAKHKTFVTLVVAWLTVGLVCSLALYAAERGNNAAIQNPFDALWWAVGSITTVGSDLFPVTAEGRTAAMVLMVLGVFLFSAITATITSFLLAQPADVSSTINGIAAGLLHAARLHDDGRLSDAEFILAKERILRAPTEGSSAPLRPS